MIKINLLPVKEAKKKATLQNQIVVVIVVLLVVLAGIIYMVVARKGQINSLDNTIAQKKKELAELQSIQKQMEQYKKDNEILQKKIEVITGLERGRDWYLQLIDQLSEAIPQNETGQNAVWIDNLITGKGESTGALYNTAWELKGGATEKDQISNFISNLEKRNKYFGVVNLKKVELQAKSGLGSPFYQYQMSVEVKKPMAEGALPGSEQGG